MIPKIIHYCWFGGNPLPDKLKKYIETWSIHCPDYEIKLWDEKTFDVNSHSFTKSAYESRKYAYVSDYVRAFALYEYGGIYLDTDVELKKNLDEFLEHEAFTGFEKKGLPFTAVWGAEKNHILSKLIIDYYFDRIYNDFQVTNTLSVTEILVEKFLVNPDLNERQIGIFLEQEIYVYPAETFCLDLPVNYATHHFEGSWIENKKTSYKSYLNAQYHLDKSFEEIDNSYTLSKSIATSLTYKIIFTSIFVKMYYDFSPMFLRKLFNYLKR